MAVVNSTIRQERIISLTAASSGDIHVYIHPILLPEGVPETNRPTDPQGTKLAASLH